MKKIIQFLIPVFVFMMLILPPVLSAQQEGLVPCGKAQPNAQGVISDECKFNDFMELLNRVINFALFNISIPIAAIMFAYAGVSLITAGSAEGKTTAKNVFTSTVIGLVIAALAWVVVKTLLTILGYQTEYL